MTYYIAKAYIGRLVTPGEILREEALHALGEERLKELARDGMLEARHPAAPVRRPEQAPDIVPEPAQDEGEDECEADEGDGGLPDTMDDIVADEEAQDGKPKRGRKGTQHES